MSFKIKPVDTDTLFGPPLYTWEINTPHGRASGYAGSVRKAEDDCLKAANRLKRLAEATGGPGSDHA